MQNLRKNIGVVIAIFILIISFVIFIFFTGNSTGGLIGSLKQSSQTSSVSWLYDFNYNSSLKSIIHRKEYSGFVSALEFLPETGNFAKATLREFNGGDDNNKSTMDLTIPNSYLTGSLYDFDTVSLKTESLNHSDFIDKLKSIGGIDLEISYPESTQGNPYVSRFYLLN